MDTLPGAFSRGRPHSPFLSRLIWGVGSETHTTRLPLRKIQSGGEVAEPLASILQPIADESMRPISTVKANSFPTVKIHFAMSASILTI